MARTDGRGFRSLVGAFPGVQIMPSLAPYIPSKDADLDNWSANFSTLITANPMLYGLTSTDASNIAAPTNVWHAAYTLVTSPTTKTAQTVSDKNTAKVNMLNIIRPYAQQVALNPGVASSDKIALGLNPRTSTPTPITAPTTYPAMSFISAFAGLWNMTARDSVASPSVKAKPYGVKNLTLYAKPSATPITDPTLLPQFGIYTKFPFQISLPGGYTPGGVWYLAAKWTTQKGLQGPFSPIQSLVAQ